MRVILPIRTCSEMNTREHWAAKARRAKSQRTCAAALVRGEALASAQDIRHAAQIEVRLTRIAPRELDSDNLAGAMKHIRDGIADALGMDDRDPRVAWMYSQRRGAPKEYMVEVTIEGREA